MINITYKISSWFYKEQVVKEVLNINLFFIKSWGKENIILSLFYSHYDKHRDLQRKLFSLYI